MWDDVLPDNMSYGRTCLMGGKTCFIGGYIYRKTCLTGGCVLLQDMSYGRIMSYGKACLNGRHVVLEGMSKIGF